MSAQNMFYKTCLGILQRSQKIPEVFSVINDIREGIEYENNFPKTMESFILQRNEIISYIQKVRFNNIVDAFKEERGSLALIPFPNGKLLTELSPQELFNNLHGEIPRLILNGMYHVIKHSFPISEDRIIMQDLFSNDMNVLIKYGLLEDRIKIVKGR